MNQIEKLEKHIQNETNLLRFVRGQLNKVSNAQSALQEVDSLFNHEAQKQRQHSHTDNLLAKQRANLSDQINTLNNLQMSKQETVRELEASIRANQNACKDLKALKALEAKKRPRTHQKSSSSKKRR